MTPAQQARLADFALRLAQARAAASEGGTPGTISAEVFDQVADELVLYVADNGLFTDPAARAGD